MARDIPSEVTSIIQQHLDAQQNRLTLEASFIDDLGADSLSLVELTLALEEHFEIDIADEEAQTIRTVQEAITLVERKCRETRTYA